MPPSAGYPWCVSEKMRSEVLGVMGCEFELRPAGAPHFGDLAGAVKSVRRDEGALIVTYQRRVRAALAEVVAAERLCCAGIGWELSDDGATLRVTAAPEQLDLMAQLVRVGSAGRGDG